MKNYSLAPECEDIEFSVGFWQWRCSRGSSESLRWALLVITSDSFLGHLGAHKQVRLSVFRNRSSLSILPHSFECLYIQRRKHFRVFLDISSSINFVIKFWSPLLYLSSQLDAWALRNMSALSHRFWLKRYQIFPALIRARSIKYYPMWVSFLDKRINVVFEYVFYSPGSEIIEDLLKSALYFRVK